MRKKLLYLCTCLCLFQSCDKENLSPLAELEQELTATFEVSIAVTDCFNEGSLLSVTIPNPELYGYLWEVNGQHGGHHNETAGCQCIEKATVQVMRLSDGLRVEKSIELNTNCSSNSTKS